MIKYRYPLWAVSIVLILTWTAGLVYAQDPPPLPAQSTPLGTAFTYQGLLQDGQPLDDSVDLRFTLWDDAGTQVGNAVERYDVTVADGLFTVQLDFGSTFSGEARWLEIAVRHPAGSGEYITLEPRQELTAVPYALHARSAPWGGLDGVPDAFADGVDDDTLADLSADVGQIPQWDGSSWVAATISTTEYTAGSGLELSGAEFRVLFGASGIAATAARSDHNHSGAYALSGHVHGAEDIIGPVNEAITATHATTATYAVGVAWSGLRDVPAGFADNVDDDTLADLNADVGQVAQWDGSDWVAATLAGTNYVPGIGLTLTDTQFDVDFAGSGTSDTVARSDHDHGGVYAPGSHEHDASHITSGTLDGGRFSAYADLTAEGYLGDAAGDLAQNSGTLQSSLNADLLDGQHAGEFAPVSHIHAGSQITSTVAEALSATHALAADGVPWTGVSGMPAGFTDAIDDDTLGGLAAGVGQVPQWDGSAWVAATPGGGGAHDHFGESWIGPEGSTSGLTVTNGFGYGIRGESASPTGAGVYAYNSSTGAALEMRSDSGRILVAYGSDPTDVKFRFETNGNAYADANWNTGWADFAEMLPAEDGLEPGDVLAIGPDGTLVRSSEAYQPTVAGVYSTQPGFVGGAGPNDDLTGKIPLAIMGVVPVKASAENGAIRPGDLLVTSSIPGHAMKAGPTPSLGTVIGKALAGLERGTGVIRMLVTLQ